MSTDTICTANGAHESPQFAAIHTCPDRAPAPTDGPPLYPALLVVVLLVALGRLLVRHRGRELRFLYALMAPIWGHRVFLTTLLRISRTRDGIAPVVRLRLWPLAAKPVLLVNHMATARSVMSQGDLFHSMGGDNPAIVSLLGAQGLFTTHTTDSPEWQRRRKVTDPLLSSDPTFTDRTFTDLLAASRKYAAAWHGTLTADTPGQLLHEIARVMLPAQSIAFFGELFSADVNRRAGEDLLANFRGVGEGLFFAPTAWLRSPRTRHSLARAWSYVADITRIIVADARNPEPHEDAADQRPGLFRLCSTAFRDGIYGEAEVRDTVAVFLNAGAPTHLVFWTLHTLAHHPDVEARVVAELQAALARGPLDFGRLRELAELRRVVLEVMRIYPPVPLFQPRRAVRDTRLGDIPVPAGTQLLISPYVAHRDPALGPDRESFDPGREGNNVLAPHMFPFSVGQRTCPGRNFSMLAVTAALVAILERHRVILHAHTCPTPSEAIYCRPSHDVQFSVVPRVHAGARPTAEATMRPT